MDAPAVRGAPDGPVVLDVARTRGTVEERLAHMITMPVKRDVRAVAFEAHADPAAAATLQRREGVRLLRESRVGPRQPFGLRPGAGWWRGVPFEGVSWRRALDRRDELHGAAAHVAVVLVVARRRRPAGCAVYRRGHLAPKLDGVLARSVNL